MCKKLIHSTFFVFVLGAILASVAGAADPSLVAWYRFDGDASDSSGNNLHGREVGNPTYVAGVFGQAIDLDGTDDYVDCGNPPQFTIRDQITFTYWIQVRAFDADWNTVIAKGDDSWRSSRAGTNNFMEAAVGGTSGNYLYAVTPVNDGQWHHVGATYDGTTFYLYVDGKLDASEPSTGQIAVSTFNVYIGDNSGATGRHWNGLIDDVMIYNRAFSQEEIQRVMQSSAGAYPVASTPSPADGAILAATWVSLGWKPGDFAVSHDVYMGESFDDVNAGTGNTFRVNQTDPFFLVGIGLPGDPYPGGLVPGTTYYWRVDEVNQADPNSPWKGNVWSFTVPPKKAYNPAPADGSKFLDAAAVTLSWTAGFGAKLHYVYFGNNLDTVANAVGGVPQGTTTYKPAGLQAAKTYYWRVDEFDAAATYKGDVWSFTTGKTGGGVKGQYYKGMAFETLVLTRTDPQINFNWGDPGGPDPAVGNDQFSARWTGEIEAAFTETYTFYASADDGVRLWVDGKQLVNAWVDQGTTEYRGTIDLVAGNAYSFVMEYYENGGGAVAELRWSSPRTPRQIIPQAALSLPVRASNPIPANGTTGVSQNPLLQWQRGDFVASHEVYFGTDSNAVKNATKTSPEYKATQTRGSESYAAAALDWQTTYYWRIDEVNTPNPSSPWVGNVWSFTTADYGVVDDFEYYNDIAAGQAGSNLVYMAWLDGFGTTTNGSTMGYPTGSSLETTNVHGGGKAVPLIYNNSTASFSEVERTFAAQDWTSHGIQTLSLWFHGDPTSVPGQLYVKINGVKVPYDGDASNLKKPLWQTWNITLASVGTNLQSVTRLAIGIETKGATGTLLLDDIRLYPTAPILGEQIWLEAETGTITAPMKIYNDPLASGGKYIGTDDGIGDETANPPATGVATYNFTAQGGVYKISLRVIITGGSNSFWVRVPSATNYNPGTHTSGWIRFNDISDGAAWHWDDVHSSDHNNQVVSITIPAGQNTLEIARREDGALLDAIVISKID